jgi:Protein of unknown function, DUF255
MMSSLASASGAGREGEGKGTGAGIGIAAKGGLGSGLGRGEQPNASCSSISAGEGDEKEKESKMEPLVNRAGGSRSPYVRGHMNNLVAWQLWGDEAIERARKENKLMFVSIGYSACHCMSACFITHFTASYASVLLTHSTKGAM